MGDRDVTETAWFVAPEKGFTFDTTAGPVRASGRYIRLTKPAHIAAARACRNLWEIRDPADFGKWHDIQWVPGATPDRIANPPDLGIGDRIPLLVGRGASGADFMHRFPKDRYFAIGINAGVPTDAAAKYYPASDVFLVKHEDVEAVCSMDAVYAMRIGAEWLKTYRGFFITPRECAYRCYTGANVIAYQWPWTDQKHPARCNQSLVFAAGFLACAGYKRAVITGVDLKTSAGAENESETNRRTKTTRGLRWLEATYGIKFFNDRKSLFKEMAPVWEG